MRGARRKQGGGRQAVPDFDPTNERTPVGNLPSYLQGSYGILASGAASQVIALPVLAPDANGTERKGTFTLSPDGALTGSVDTSHMGPGEPICACF